MTKTREQRRIESADRVCRELRWQIQEYGLVGDWTSFNKHFDVWMNNSNKTKYKRP